MSNEKDYRGMFGALCIFFGIIVGFIIGTSIPHKPTVMTQTVPAVCSSTIITHDPPTKEDCILLREESGGHNEPEEKYTPESLVPAIMGTWKAVDGSVTVIVDPPRLARSTSKKTPYHLRLILPNDAPDRGFGCDFMIDGPVFDSNGPLANKMQYRAWCRDHKDARVAFKFNAGYNSAGEDELIFALQLEDKMKVTSTKLLKTP